MLAQSSVISSWSITRVVGRRPGKQLTPFEFVLILYIGGLPLIGIVGQEVSITNSPVNVALGYGLSAALMLAGALCKRLIGVEAAGKRLESVSKPLQSP